MEGGEGRGVWGGVGGEVGGWWGWGAGGEGDEKYDSDLLVSLMIHNQRHLIY